MGGITGTILNTWGEPVFRAVLRLYLKTGLVTSTETDEDGVYLFDELEPDTYYVKATHEHYEGEWWDDKPSPEEADPIVVEDSLVENIDFTLCLTWNGKIKRAKTVSAGIASTCEDIQTLANFFLSGIFKNIELTPEQKDAFIQIYLDFKSDIANRFQLLP